MSTVQKLELLKDKKKKLELQQKVIADREKRKRVKLMTESGRLAEKAGILDLEKEALFGAFLKISEQMREIKNIEMWKNLAAEKNEENPSLAICFKSNPDAGTKRDLRSLGFKWNTFRKEFYGSGNPTELQELLSDKDVKIEILK